MFAGFTILHSGCTQAAAANAPADNAVTIAVAAATADTAAVFGLT